MAVFSIAEQIVIFALLIDPTASTIISQASSYASVNNLNTLIRQLDNFNLSRPASDIDWRLDVFKIPSDETAYYVVAYMLSQSKLSILSFQRNFDDRALKIEFRDGIKSCKLNLLYIATVQLLQKNDFSVFSAFIGRFSVFFCFIIYNPRWCRYTGFYIKTRFSVSVTDPPL
jgi:hypothetical protein